MRGLRLSGWVGLCAAVVLAGRWFAYELAPAPTALAARLQGETAPPNALIVALVVLGIGAVLSVGTLWLAVMGVAERQRLEPRAVAPSPLSIPRLVLHAAALFVASSLAFTGFESYIHVRAGLGFHGMHCLLGPVHQDALPILGALSLLAAAVVAAAGHVLAWVRRSIALLTGGRWRVVGLLPISVPRLHADVPRSALLRSANQARAPPLARFGRADSVAVRPRGQRLVLLT
jgi:hypothetical protein